MSIAYGTHNNEEYEDQLVWNAKLDKPLEDDSEDTTMDQAKETGEKRKVEEKEEQNAKRIKNKVNLNTQKEEMNNDIKGENQRTRRKSIESRTGLPNKSPH
eukprot:6355068-Ditylum_brightwellii.AAC.1